MKIKKVLDKNTVIKWYDFETAKVVGGIILPEYVVRDVRENRGKVLFVGQNVEEVKVGDYVLYAVGPIHIPFDTDDGKVVIVAENDILFILEEEEK